jgi:hypothetical protein
MKKIIMSLMALPLALVLAFGFTVSIPTHAKADGAAAVDNQFVDGNWFTIAEAKGEGYQTGSPTQVALQAQLDLYQEAVEAKDLDKEEHYAIRSWVKGWVAAEIGRAALVAGDIAGAKAALTRAVKYGKAAQKTNAGKGETAGRVDDDTAPNYGGTSAVEGKRVVAYANKYLAKVRAKLGETAPAE